MDVELPTQFKSFITRRESTGLLYICVCKGDQVAVYDSLFTWLYAETRTTITKVRDIIMMSMQQQKGSTDSGAFAIVVMTSIAHDEDPSEIKRQHLLECITEGDLTCFPNFMD